jgi:hypothetical protein
MGEALIWIVLVAGAAALMLRLFRREEEDSGTSGPLHAVHPYHCVAVQSTATACSAALKLQGRRFLAADAPPIPLSGCTAQTCTCVYAHFDDRRHQMRRDPYVHKALDVEPLAVERRGLQGRRKTDTQYHPVN